MNIEPTKETLTAYVLGELTAEEREAVEQALEQDAEARRTLGELMVVLEWIVEAYQEEQTLQLNEEQIAKIIEGTNKAKHRETRETKDKRRFRHRKLLYAGLLGSGAVCAFLVIVALFLSATHSTIVSHQVTNTVRADHLVDGAFAIGMASLNEEQITKLYSGSCQSENNQGNIFLNSLNGMYDDGDGIYDGGIRNADTLMMFEKIDEPNTLDGHLNISNGKLDDNGDFFLSRLDGIDDDADGVANEYPGYPCEVVDRWADVDYDKGNFIDYYWFFAQNDTESYDSIISNNFLLVSNSPLSTFSIDVDTASYANIKRLIEGGALPPPDAVRIEEMINYFRYSYEPPSSKDTPFASHICVTQCPWTKEHKLVRISLKGYEMDRHERPTSNIVFLVDVSGSMDEPNKLPLVQQSLHILTNELGENDRIGMVTYADSSGVALPSTPGSDRKTIETAIDRLQAGGCTNGASGIQQAYDTAAEHFIEGGVNRVILATDGDFNVGVTDRDALQKLIESEAKRGIFLSVLGYGMGNLKDDTMEMLADKGNGNYAYIDGLREARKVLAEQMIGTLVTIAKDVKIQVEFNPARVAAYRLIGYENRMLEAKDFNDDKKDAGEIGAGHTVTALYEIVPAGVATARPSVDPLRYQPSPTPAISETQSYSDELLTLKLRYKAPDGDVSKLLEFPVKDSDGSFEDAPEDVRFAAAVAAFGMLLRGSQYAGTATYDDVLNWAMHAMNYDPQGYRAEFLDLARKAKSLSGAR